MRDDQLETGSSEPLPNGSSATGLAAAPTAGMSLGDDGTGETDHPIPVERAASNEAAAAERRSADQTQSHCKKGFQSHDGPLVPDSDCNPARSLKAKEYMRAAIRFSNISP